jgi:conjugative transposon TraN protein
MKKISAIFYVIILLFSAKTYAQISRIEITSQITPLQLLIAANKTTNLIFPYAIKSVDKGSNELLVQKAKGIENVLQVKASKPAFTPTNLSVITADGQLYAFSLSFNAQPPLLNIRLGIVAAKGSTPDAIFSASKDNEAQTDDAAEQVAVKKPSLGGYKASGNDIKMALEGIYIKNDVLYFQLLLENNSNVNFDIDQLRCYVRDQKKAKRTASQEQELTPIKITGNNKVIRAESRQTIVVAMPKLTMPDQKYMSVELLEAHGSRNLGFKIDNKALIRAIRL